MDRLVTLSVSWSSCNKTLEANKKSTLLKSNPQMSQSEIKR